MDLRVFLADAGGNQGPDHVPGVAIVGLIAGLALIVAAIRYMFGKRKP